MQSTGNAFKAFWLQRYCTKGCFILFIYLFFAIQLGSPVSREFPISTILLSGQKLLFLSFGKGKYLNTCIITTFLLWGIKNLFGNCVFILTYQ
jgi:hypothetical protein